MLHGREHPGTLVQIHFGFFSNIRVCNSCTFDTYMPIMISNFGIIAMFLENAFIGCLTFLANTVCK